MAFSFNKDGSLAASPKRHRDHLPLLLALEEIPFGMGKKLLIDHLRGKQNARTTKLRLDRYTTNGELGGYQDEEVQKLITHLEQRQLITIKREKGIYPVYALTPKGQEELLNPEIELRINDLDQATEKQLAIKNPFPPPPTPTPQERQLITALEDLFPDFNEQQRLAVVATGNHVLCVAGAGSGKTSVLTKRIAFLTTYRSVDPERILAITFTRKARKEMQERLAAQRPHHPVRIETFNSFSEKTLQRHGNKLYGKEVTMASFKEQLQLLIDVLKRHGHTQDTIIDAYFTTRQRNGKDKKTLFFSFAYDFNTLIDKIRITQKDTTTLKKAIRSSQEHAALANKLLAMADDYLKAMRQRGIRDYTDQLLDTIELFKKHPDTIPRYDHVLVDEYQDVNDQQIALLDLLAPENLFAVGDPRQSIYGWRGSRVNHILCFPERHQESQVIQLTTNYRSAREIVGACNDTIRQTGYEDLRAATDEKGIITVKHHPTEDEQASAIIKAIKEHEGDRHEVFVLSRTNKGLEKLQDYCRAHGIDYLLRTDELKRPGVEPKKDQVTLATVHAIKGLEAAHVHLINANATNFPCKASDHPVMDLFRLQEDYDSYAEELRVLYVALSRAKKSLHINYTGAPSPFLPERLIKPPRQRRLPKPQDAAAAMMRLRQWRYQQAKERGVPAYVICTDATLEAIIQERPATEEELYAIPGLGPSRVQDFGTDLLALIAKL